MSYPGGKSGPGVWQRIINQIPPCDVLVSGFLGRCGVLSRIRRPRRVVGIDRDSAVIDWWRSRLGRNPQIRLVCEDSIGWLDRAFRSHELGFTVPASVVCYLDPPYLRETRLSGRDRYECEMADADSHRRLLVVVSRLPCKVIINHPPCSLYDNALLGWGWRTIDYMASSRGGMIPDRLWLNYPEPAALQDTRFVGGDRRERERIRRRVRRWTDRLKSMPALERAALLAALQEV
jgi:DNA adenine methylase